MSASLFHKYQQSLDEEEEDRDSRRTPFEHKNNNASNDDDTRATPNQTPESDDLRQHIKSEPLTENEDATKCQQSLEEGEEDDGYRDVTSTPPSHLGYNPHAAGGVMGAGGAVAGSLMPPQSDASEHSLMKMQMRKFSFSL